MTFKLLIVDDESTMRKGIAEFMNWNAIDCEVAGTANDGLEAIEFLKNHEADIIITDIRMPEADGLCVAKYVFENCPEKKVILLTGYADFEYAQTAIHYNVSAFILKPTNKKELFEAVQTAQKQLVSSKRQFKIAKEEDAFLKEQFLQVLTDHAYKPQFEEKLLAYQLDLDHYYVAAFRLIPYHEDISSLKKIIIDEKENAYCYRYNNLIITVYFHSDFGRILANCNEIEAIMRTLDSREISVGISRLHTAPATFRQAVSEAIRALTFNFYAENNVSVFSSEKMENCDLTAENSLDLFQFENLLLDWQFAEAEILLRNIFAKFKRNFLDAQEVKNICSQIYYICSRITIKKELPALSTDHLTAIRSACDIFALEQAVTTLFCDIRDSLNDTSTTQNQLAEKAMQYIRENLSSDLSLEQIADHLHISASHLSRTFKKTANISLTDHINQVRIDRAKELLRGTDIYIYAISEMVGYHDATYFSSIFKKLAGVSPSEYRNLISSDQVSFRN
ncbi:MAG: response regulator [Lachnospiraceae bacterium]|nr:response regulator [Lachnospiraceae bacterium]